MNKGKIMRSLAAGILVMLFGIILIANIPIQYGGPLSEVAVQYTKRSLQDTEASNMVAAILADYRLYDTLGEAVVLFAAILGVTMILGRDHHKTDQKIDQVDQLYGG
ncbi:MAG: hypothetical protein HXS46_16390 [Theionarchaea archaeon]|nr:MAG: hypothetical protein AYK18_12260 [Theionarchaea archaeon DG-70]MBU7012262.1 hypothetical protein [Theionarchaea archaeon]